jgi:hypothetical protein
LIEVDFLGGWRNLRTVNLFQGALVVFFVGAVLAANSQSAKYIGCQSDPNLPIRG